MQFQHQFHCHMFLYHPENFKLSLFSYSYYNHSIYPAQQKSHIPLPFLLKTKMHTLQEEIKDLCFVSPLDNLYRMFSISIEPSHFLTLNQLFESHKSFRFYNLLRKIIADSANQCGFHINSIYSHLQIIRQLFIKHYKE